LHKTGGTGFLGYHAGLEFLKPVPVSPMDIKERKKENHEHDKRGSIADRGIRLHGL
jgi:hypothetical protein